MLRGRLLFGAHVVTFAPRVAVVRPPPTKLALRDRWTLKLVSLLELSTQTSVHRALLPCSRQDTVTFEGAAGTFGMATVAMFDHPDWTVVFTAATR